MNGNVLDAGKFVKADPSPLKNDAVTAFNTSNEPDNRVDPDTSRNPFYINDPVMIVTAASPPIPTP